MSVVPPVSTGRPVEGTIEAAPHIAGSRAYGKVKTASVDTNEPTRDAHLRTADFFDVERYPEVVFESKRIEPLGGPRHASSATSRSRARPATSLDSTAEGSERDPWGNDRIGLRASGKIDRKDFGLTWQSLLESGGYLLGDEVKLLVEVSAVRVTDGGTAA